MPTNPSVSFKRDDVEYVFPLQRRYSMNHYWFLDCGEGLIRCGFTPMVYRLMGDVIDFELTIKPAEKMLEYDVIGQIESMKALNDLYAPMTGIFKRCNPILDIEMDALAFDPLGKGWLYEIVGQPPLHCFGAEDYCVHLDACLETMKGRD